MDRGTPRFRQVVPLIVITTVRFIHFRVQSFEVFTPAWQYALALILNTLVVFLLLYGLALHHRRNPERTRATWWAEFAGWFRGLPLT